MELSFHKVAADSQRKILQIVQKLKQKAWDAQQDWPAPQSAPPAATLVSTSGAKSGPASPGLNACFVLVSACETLAIDFDSWKSARSAAEIEQLRNAVAKLHAKLASANSLEMCLSAAAVGEV